MHDIYGTPFLVLERPWGGEGIPESAELVRDLGGRIVGRVDYNSYQFRLYRGPGVYLRVNHGGGQEDYAVRDSGLKAVLDALLALDDDTLYIILFSLRKSQKEGYKAGYQSAQDNYRKAFAEDRLKKRKLRGQDRVKIWIEDPSERKVS